MSAPEPHRIRALFDAALALPEAERAAFLQDACPENPNLNAAVSRLLAASRASSGFLASATLTTDGTALTEAGGLQTGDHIGPYQITGELGRGGSGGVVYLARQHHPVDREVALKILSATPDATQAAERFRSEQRTLARMEHDHIARLHDAGIDPRGRLWFAMELVRGQPITTFCDAHRLTIPERLQLLSQICRAVHHAHLRGVIHRDLKPSNLLVSTTNGNPVPKVIDFGIARALENASDAHLTLCGGIIGTPAYMSPEQFGDGTGDIDARTDIYSLGLILFEILTGLRAREISPGSSAALQAARTLLTEDQLSATQRFSAQSPDLQKTLAHARQTSPNTLRKFLSGDAGRIIARCLTRDPAGRFPSAESLAADLDHLLAHRPLSFRRPGFLYPAGKFLRRHRTAAIVSSLALLTASVSLGMGLQSRLARLAAEARAQAEAARAAQETARAAREGHKGYLITQAMSGIFRSATPDYGHRTDRTIRSVVEAWTATLPNSVTEDQEVEALVRLSLGNAWTGFGEPDNAYHQFTTAAALLANPSPAFAPARALTELNLASLDLQLNRYPSAEKHLQEARRYFTASGESYSTDLLRTELLLAGQRTQTGDPEGATRLAQRVLDEARARFPDNSELQARAHWQLARAARQSGDQPAWASHLRQRLDLVQRDPDIVPTVVLEAKFDVLQADYLTTPDRPAALAAMDQLLQEYARLTSPTHPTTLAFRTDLANLLANANQPSEARQRYQSLIHDAPDAPTRQVWEEAVSALQE